MRRREFITLLGGSAAVWPLAALGQQSTIPVVGFLSTRAPEESAYAVAALRRGLGESGYVEGRNVTVEYRWGYGQYDRLPGLAAEFVRRQVAVIMAGGGEPAALAAKAATSTIPIVFIVGRDPVKLGLAASYNHPGGNATGISILDPTLEAKRLGLLHGLVSNATVLGVLLNPTYPPATVQLSGVEQAARAVGVELHVLRASTDGEIEAAFDTIARLRLPALLQVSDPFFVSRRVRLVALAAHHAVPTMYNFREYVLAGGLMSYGINLSDAYRQQGAYAGRILNGAKPADLPIVQPTRFNFVLNLKTAKALSLNVPDKLLALADEVIE